MPDEPYPPKTVSTWGIVVGLISLHYGMGFILGTGEQTYLHGSIGAVYAIAAGLGLLGISVLADFYWRTQQPIWDLLGDKYGQPARHLSNFLSWTWMIGVMAGQMLGAGYALSVLGFPAYLAVVCAAVAIALLGSIPLERVAWFFAILLSLSTLALLFSLTQLGGISIYLSSIQTFFPDLLRTSPMQILGVVVTTFLLTIIGMDFQQVLVTAQDQNAAVKGSLFAGLILLPTAFIPTAVVIGAVQKMIVAPGVINGKDAIPLILARIGNGVFPFGGLVLVAALVIVAVGSGTGLNRALIRSFQSAPFMPSSLKKSAAASWINAALALGLAFTGLTIVGLMVSFYAIYVSGVFVPFMAYLVERRGKLSFTAIAIQVSAWTGSVTASLVLVTGIMVRLNNYPILGWIGNATEAWMILMGLVTAGASLGIAQSISKGQVKKKTLLS